MTRWSKLPSQLQQGAQLSRLWAGSDIHIPMPLLITQLLHMFCVMTCNNFPWDEGQTDRTIMLWIFIPAYGLESHSLVSSQLGHPQLTRNAGRLFKVVWWALSAAFGWILSGPIDLWTFRWYSRSPTGSHWIIGVSSFCHCLPIQGPRHPGNNWTY